MFFLVASKQSFAKIDATGEFRILVAKQGEMDTLTIQVELDAQQCQTLAELFQQRMAMRVKVDPVPAGSLPRFEAKAKRLIDQRNLI